jgi:hypothetical protein
MDNIVIRKKLRFDLHKKELLKIMSQFTLYIRK